MESIGGSGEAELHLDLVISNSRVLVRLAIGIEA